MLLSEKLDQQSLTPMHTRSASATWRSPRAGQAEHLHTSRDSELVETAANLGVCLWLPTRTHLASGSMGNFPMASRGAGSWSLGSAETNLQPGFLGKSPGQALRLCWDLTGCQASGMPEQCEKRAAWKMSGWGALCLDGVPYSKQQPIIAPICAGHTGSKTQSSPQGALGEDRKAAIPCAPSSEQESKWAIHTGLMVPTLNPVFMACHCF